MFWLSGRDRDAYAALSVEDASLGPMDEHFAPLAQAVGRAVMAAAALERVLLVDIISRMAQRDGLRAELEHDLRALERRPGGRLLEKLKELEIRPDLAARILSVIARRNTLIHHYMEQPAVIVALMTGAGIDALVADVDSLAVECQQVVNEIAPDSFAGLQRVLSADVPQLIQAIKHLDLSRVESPSLREQMQALQQLDLTELERLFDDAAGR